MRYLHTIAAHETFIASGVYRTYRAGTELPVREAWTLHELKGGANFIRVDEDARDEDGLSILSEALISPEGQIERFNVQSFSSKDSAIKLFKADYTFQPDYVQIGRKTAGQEHEYEEFQLQLDAVTYIKQTLYMGYTLRDILAKGTSSHVFAPQLLSVGVNQMQKIIVQSKGTENLQVGRKKIAAFKFQIADDVFYWLDEHHIPLQREYQYEGVAYQVKLTDYAHK